MIMSVDPATELRARVKAAVQDYDAVVQFHESWRIAAHDKALHERVSHSFAGQTFLIVRGALRREMLLGLSRLWDHRTEAIKIVSIADDLENRRSWTRCYPTRRSMQRHVVRRRKRLR